MNHQDLRHYARLIRIRTANMILELATRHQERGHDITQFVQDLKKVLGDDLQRDAGMELRRYSLARVN